MLYDSAWGAVAQLERLNNPPSRGGGLHGSDS